MTHLYKSFLLRFFISCVLILLTINTTNAQGESKPEQLHEITIYVMPTLFPIDWTSPSTLFTSMKNCYLKTVTVPDNYLLGHIAVQINTPLLPKPLYTAMTSASPMEKVDLVLKQKIGYGIFGATLQGRLESEKELHHKLDVYAKRKKLAFMTFSVSEQAAQRMIEFIHKFSTNINDQYAPCNFYGGAFWPRFENEGSGCSAFGMALLEIAQATPVESKEWLVSVKVPMKLIGGEYNRFKRIKNTTIKQTNSWYTGNGNENEDFISHFVYEPSIMFDWIVKRQNETNSSFMATQKDGIPGLYFDKRDVAINATEPIFDKRKHKNLFIESYFGKLALDN